jgi:hypothetical protein
MMGLYKPNPNNYHYCLSHIKDDFGFEKEETLIVAQSLDIDHVASTWIAWNLGVTAMGGNYGKLLAAGKIKIGAKFEWLGEMGALVESAFNNSFIESINYSKPLSSLKLPCLTSRPSRQRS